MRRILNKVDQRHLKLLEILWGNGWKRITEAAKMLKVTERTLKNDIQVINDVIQPLYIEMTDKSELYLHTTPEKGKSYLYSKILEKSWEFSLIECSFLKDFSDLYDFCEMNFISEETTKKRMRRLNKVLKEKGFSFDTSGHLIGSEVTLRNFIVQFMIEKYEHVFYVCDRKQMRLINEFVDYFLAKNLSEIDAAFFYYGELNRLKMSIYLSIKRIQLGHYVTQHLVNKNPRLDFFIEQPLSKKFEEQFGIPLNKRNVQDLFYLVIEQLQVSSFEDLLLVTEKNKQKQELLNRLLDLIHELEAEFEIACTNKEHLLIKLYRILTVSGPYYIIYDKVYDFFVGISSECNFVVAFLEKKIEDRLLDGKNDAQLTHQIIFELLTSWNGLLEQIKGFMPKIRACLFLDSTKEHAEFLKEKLDHHLHPRFVFEIASVTSTGNLRKNAKKYDCILTNVSCLELSNIPVISISNYVNASELDLLLKFYENKVKTWDKNFLKKAYNSRF